MMKVIMIVTEYRTEHFVFVMEVILIDTVQIIFAKIKTLITDMKVTK